MSMRSELRRGGEIVYRYKLNDIRRFASQKDRLSESTFPEDWVLGLLVAKVEDHSEQDWRDVAQKMRCELDPERPETAEYRTILLIASILRDIAWETQEDISNMIEINVSGNRLLRQVFEQGIEAAYPFVEIDRIKRYISRKELSVDPAVFTYLEDATPEEVIEFADQFDDADDKQSFLNQRRYGR